MVSEKRLKKINETPTLNSEKISHNPLFVGTPEVFPLTPFLFTRTRIPLCPLVGVYGGANLKIGLPAGVVGTTYRQWGGLPGPHPLYSEKRLTCRGRL